MPYIERDEDGRVVCLYSALDPMFQQARTYLSTGKLQARLEEYPAVIAEAQRLGVTVDEAVGQAEDKFNPDRQWTICGRWPDWVDDADLEGSTAAASDQDNGETGEQADEYRAEDNADEVAITHPETIAESIAAVNPAEQENEASLDHGPDSLGDSIDAAPDYSSDIGEYVEAGSDVDAGADPAGDSEPMGADLEPAEPNSYPGMMIAGDALASAKAIALMKVDDERYIRVGDYDKTANQARLDELRAIQQAIREGVHPPFTSEQAEELQALETFLPFIQRIDDHAQGLRNAIREADDLDALAAIDLQSGWPE